MSLSNRHNLPGLIDAPNTGDLQQSQWMQQLTQVVRQGTGQHGASDEKWLTLKDLENLHVVEKNPGGGYTPGGGGGSGGGDTEPPDLSPPEPLKNLEARGGMTAIRILWDNTQIDYYYRIEVHKSAVDDIGDAFLVGTSQGFIFSDVVGSDTSTWYYWARIVKQVGSHTIVGPWNQTQGTPAAAAHDPDWVLGDLEGKINDSHLNDNLSDPIGKIPDIEKDVGDMEDSIKDIEIDMDGVQDSIKKIDLDISELEAGLNTEITERETEDESLHKRIDTNVSRIGDNAAAIVTESETRATEDEALARSITTLKAEVDDNSAAIQTESETRATEDEALAKQITTLTAEVDGNTAAIQSESEVRASEDEVLAKRIDTQTARIDDNAAAIQTESEVRATEDEALASQITLLAAEVGDNTAAIKTESEVRATEDEALASRITTMQVEVDGNKAAIQTESEVRASEDEVLAKRIDTQTVRIDDNAAAIQTESEVRATEDEALAKQITTLAAEVGENSAAIQEESTVRASEDEVLASRITTLRVDMDDASAAIRDEMTVIIDEGQKLASRVQTVELDLDDTKGAIETRMKAIENEMGDIRLEYTVVVDNDGYAGGFSIINEDGVIAALWRVDIFAVGAPGCDSLAFAIDAEENRVVMDGALIKNATINTAQIGELDVDKIVGDTAVFVEANIREGSIINAKIGNVIQSNGFVSGEKGWILNKSGYFESQNAYIRGRIHGSEITGSVIQGSVIIGSDDMLVPTEADRGPGSTRFLTYIDPFPISNGSDFAVNHSADDSVLTVVERSVLISEIKSADFTGDGETNGVWNNYRRYKNYKITPDIKINTDRTKWHLVGYDPSADATYSGVIVANYTVELEGFGNPLIMEFQPSTDRGNVDVDVDMNNGFIRFFGKYRSIARLVIENIRGTVELLNINYMGNLPLKINFKVSFSVSHSWVGKAPNFRLSISYNDYSYNKSKVLLEKSDKEVISELEKAYLSSTELFKKREVWRENLKNEQPN